MLTKSYGLYEIEVCTQNLLGSMVRQHTHQQSHDTLDNEGITLCLEVQQAVPHVGLQPYAALTSVYEILFRLIFVIQFRLTATQVNEQLVSVHPIIKVSKLLDNLVLYLVDRHASALSL